MEEWIKQLRQATNTVNIYDILQIVIMEYNDLFVELNKKQLDKGKKSDGSYTSPYSSRWEKTRKEFGLQTKVKDLDFFGDFKANMFTAPSGRFYTEFNSSDEKTGRLIAMEGKEIFGLDEESIASLPDSFYERISELYMIKTLNA